VDLIITSEKTEFNNNRTQLQVRYRILTSQRLTVHLCRFLKYENTISEKKKEKK
jgi:hypothetical protein